MPDRSPPDEIRRLADERAAARRERDFETADRLKAEINAAGWKVVDRGTYYDLEPAWAADIDEGGRRRYGRSESVPSRLDDPADVSIAATVVMPAGNAAGNVARAVAGLRRHSPAIPQLVVVADAPDPDVERALESVEGVDEIVVTSAPLGFAASLNAGIRRSAAAIAVVLDPSVEPTGDIVTPLVDALDDPGVAIAGGRGVRSRDLRTFEDAPSGDADAVLGDVLAFRRDDYRSRGPLDERFRFYRHLDLWWSLMLRDEGEGVAPRRAVALDLPLVRHDEPDAGDAPEEERARLSRRNFYRIIDRFGSRTDLLLQPGPRRAAARSRR